MHCVSYGEEYLQSSIFDVNDEESNTNQKANAPNHDVSYSQKGIFST